MNKQILIAIPEKHLKGARNHLDEVACRDWRSHIRFVLLEDKKLSRKLAITQGEANARAISDTLLHLEQVPASIIVVCFIPNEKHLIEEELYDYSPVFLQTLSAFRRELNSILMDCQLHWLPYAEAEWRKSDIGHISPQKWMQQCAELGHGPIAKLLLQNLRVIENSELRKSFIISASESFGYRVAHSYIKDDEQGSSSINIQSILGKIYPENIVALDLKDEDCWSKISADVLYIYEDGLWSGVEIVKRMKAILENPKFKASNLRINFRYCVTCDIGLAAARLFSRANNISRFYVDASTEKNYYKFLDQSTDISTINLEESDHTATRALLDKMVDPYAFQAQNLDEEKKTAALSFCELIGAQLIEQYLTREQKKKSEGENKPISQEKIHNWSLGAMRFASTIIFSSSVPKPVLPMFWLAGDVIVNGTKKKWEPLFWDARRMKASAPNTL